VSRAGDVGAGAWGIEAEKLQVPRSAGDDLLDLLELAGYDPNWSSK
jgi:hypothetical protein